MDPGSGEWRLDRWGPTAPESCILLDGWKGSGKEAFRLAVLECIARRRLAVAGQTDLPSEEAPTGLLLPGTETRPTGDRPLDAIREIFDEARSKTSGDPGVHIKQLSRATRRRYGSLDGYVKTEVLPALKRRGLYECRDERLLWLLPVARWELTRIGEASRMQLQRNRRLGEEHFGEWIRRDPEQAYRFLGLAGSSLLLMEALHPELRELQDPEDDGEGVMYPPAPPELGGDFDLETLPDLGGALSASDSWSDGAGSGSGGWFDGGSGGWFDGGGGGFDGGGGGGFDGGGGGGFDGGGGGGGF